jgi:poly [ADP-ribose] polymerase
MKGKVPIDDFFPLKKEDYHVLEMNGKVYSATLNQTNIMNNNNKFYIVQILQSDTNNNINYLFTRWGRVGFDGNCSNLGPWDSIKAIREYESKYRDKAMKGDYREIELNYENEDEKKEEKKKEQQTNKNEEKK